MAYCTLDDIKAMVDEDELISLTDDFDTGSVVTVKVDSAIKDADALIDSYLVRQYSVPMDSVPDMVKKLSVDIAVYNIYSRRGRTSDTVEKRYNDAVKFLKDVARGDAGIIGATTAPAEMRNDAVAITTSPRIFSRRSMEGF
ncbi:MAG: DUF1320 domain-containing protein [Desulfobacterium sp.]|nr:DUF1320 domain-containing protein [Desulfobacterium sp.]